MHCQYELWNFHSFSHRSITHIVLKTGTIKKIKKVTNSWFLLNQFRVHSLIESISPIFKTVVSHLISRSPQTNKKEKEWEGMKISQPINFIDKFKHDKGMFIFTIIMTIIYAFVEVLKFQLIWLFLRLSVLMFDGVPS